MLKENGMRDNKNSRRDFMKNATRGVAGVMVGSRAVSYGNILGANDRVRVGIVGYSDRCRQALIPSLMMHAKELNFDFVAVSDTWSRRRDEGADSLGKLVGHEIAKARNNEELYERKDVDAVIIATADFQPALHGVEAVRAGRDAYVEKPMANTMEDARAILKAVEETKKIVQIGSQRRSGTNYIRANEFINSGKFGDIVMVEMTSNVNHRGAGDDLSYSKRFARKTRLGCPQIAMMQSPTWNEPDRQVNSLAQGTVRLTQL